MIRRIFTFAISIMLVLGSAAVLAESIQLRSEMTFGISDPFTEDSLPFRTARFGVNAELTAYDDIELRQQLRLMQQAGVNWVRQFVYWDRIEREPGHFDWDAYDRIVDAIHDSGDLKLVPVLMNTPEWARDEEATKDPTAPPAYPASFARFAAAFAARYADRIDYVQVWDEPNLYTNWGRLSPHAARYTALLADAYSAIHAADPHVTVIAAALAPTIETGPDNVSELVYLRDMYALGAGDSFDAAAGKPYGFDFSPDDRRVHDRLLNFSRFAALRQVMVDHGDASKPLWGSQWGWNSLPDAWRGLPSIWGGVSSAEQISYTLGAIERAEREWPWLGGLILHHWNPPYPADHPQQGFALTTPDGAPTALLAALAERPTPEHASTGWHGVRTPDASYSGVWTFSETGADIGWLRDSRLSFTFTGTDAGLLLRQDNYVAHLYVRIDGQPANALPRDAAGNAYLVLSSGSRTPDFGPVAVARDLPYGVHTLEVVADQGFDRYALAGFVVGAGDIGARYDAWVAGAALALIFSVAAAIVSGTALPLRSWNDRSRRLFAALGLPVQVAISALTSLALLTTFLLSLGSPEPPLLRREPILPLLAVLGAGTVYLNVALPLTALAALVLFWCIVQRISIGLMLTLFFAPFFLFPVELYDFAFPMVEILALMTFGAWLVNVLSGWGRLRQIGAPVTMHWPQLRTVDWLILAFVLLGAAAVTWSEYKGFAVTELRTLFIEPALFYLVFRTSKLNERELRWIVYTLLAAGASVACIGLAQYVRGDAIITAEDASRRLAGVYGSPNNLALFLGRCIPFAFAAILVARDRRTRVAAAALLVPMFIAFVLTQSVGGIFIGLPAAAVSILFFVYSRRAVPVLVVVALVLVAGFAIAASQSDRFARALDFTQGTNFYRIRVMQSAVQVIADRPLTGLGLDQFLYAFRDIYIYPDAWPEPDLSHPHNFLLDFWVRLGLAGAALALAGVYAGARMSVRIVRQASSLAFWNWVALGIAGALVDTLAHGLLDNSVFVVDLVYLFFAMLALGIAASNVAMQRKEWASRPD